MKKIIMVLVILLVAFSAFAENVGEYSTSLLPWELQLFTNELDSRDLYYEVVQYGDSDEYYVIFGYNMENTSQDASIFYNETSDAYQVFFWDFLTFTATQRTRVLEAVNTWNRTCKNFYTLYVEDDNTVTGAAAYTLIGVEDAGAYLFDCLDWCFNGLDDAYYEIYTAKGASLSRSSRS